MCVCVCACIVMCMRACVCDCVCSDLYVMLFCVFQIAGCPHPSVLSQVNISNATCMNVFIDHVSELSTSTL